MEEIIKDNCLIADFMGMERTEKEIGEPTFKQGKNAVIWASQLQYHSSWDWLMPVVEKIIQMTDVSIDFKNWYIKISADISKVKSWQTTSNDYLKQPNATMLGAYYFVVVEFIKWHNQTQIINNPSPLK